ncbi:PspC domain-containing protein [uncultured Microbacterium sp.]|uniref:PspC domain-containing protein n=1 Tax=uncultured Microbacterium sp. TaxID=191216 RepID=UPI0026192AAC|nr:PspC domain-containing protein [uncultured Microbacterium sp.]
MEKTLTSDAPPPSPPDTGFFAWVRSLGFVRTEGWIAGVCSAVARRTGTDTIIIRGIFVVAAVLGFPIAWVYAIAWALMPDGEGRIIARLRHGSAPGALGVVITAGFALIAGWAGASVFGAVVAASRPEGIGWNAGALGAWLVVIAAVVIGVAWLRRRPSPARPHGAGRERLSAGGRFGVVALSIGLGILLLILFGILAPAIFGYDAGGAGSALAMLVLLAAAFGAVQLVRTVVRRRRHPAPSFAPVSALSVRNIDGIAGELDAGEPGSEARTEGAASADDPEIATDSDYDAWRRGQDEWRTGSDEWRREQADAQRIVREQQQAEARAFAQEVARRRAERRAARPRIPFAFGAVVIGLAMLMAAAAGLFALQDEGWGTETYRALGAFSGALFAFALVCAIGMIVAGSLRRRSGFLAAVTTIALLIGGGTALGANGALGATTRGTMVTAGNEEIVQAYGALYLELPSLGDDDASIDVQRRRGFTKITVHPDVAAELRLDVDSETLVTIMGTDDDGWYVETERFPATDGVITWSNGQADPAAPVRTVDLTQIDGGHITIYVMETADDGTPDDEGDTE